MKKNGYPIVEQSEIIIRVDNLDQNKPLANRCSIFCPRDIIALQQS